MLSPLRTPGEPVALGFEPIFPSATGCISKLARTHQLQLRLASLLEARGIGRTSLDPLLSGGVWARDYTLNVAHR